MDIQNLGDGENFGNSNVNQTEANPSAKIDDQGTVTQIPSIPGPKYSSHLKSMLLISIIVIVIVALIEVSYTNNLSKLKPTSSTIALTKNYTLNITYLTSAKNILYGLPNQSSYVYNSSLGSFTEPANLKNVLKYYEGLSYQYEPFIDEVPNLLSPNVTFASNLSIPANFKNYTTPIFLEYFISDFDNGVNVNSVLCNSTIGDIACMKARNVSIKINEENITAYEKYLYNMTYNGSRIYDIVAYSANGTLVNNIIYVVHSPYLVTLTVYGIKKDYNYSYGLNIGERAADLMENVA